MIDNSDFSYELIIGEVYFTVDSSHIDEWPNISTNEFLPEIKSFLMKGEYMGGLS